MMAGTWCQADQARFGNQLDPQPVRIPQADYLRPEAGYEAGEIASLLGEPGDPRLESDLGDGEGGRLDHARSSAARGRVRERENREKASGTSCDITIIEVVGIGRIEVDGTL